jgi:hypothetical protein
MQRFRIFPIPKKENQIWLAQPEAGRSRQPFDLLVVSFRTDR